MQIDDILSVGTSIDSIQRLEPQDILHVRRRRRLSRLVHVGPRSATFSRKRGASTCSQSAAASRSRKAVTLWQFCGKTASKTLEIQCQDDGGLLPKPLFRLRFSSSGVGSASASGAEGSRFESWRGYFSPQAIAISYAHRVSGKLPVSRGAVSVSGTETTVATCGERSAPVVLRVLPWLVERFEPGGHPRCPRDVLEWRIVACRNGPRAGLTES